MTLKGTIGHKGIEYLPVYILFKQPITDFGKFTTVKQELFKLSKAIAKSIKQVEYIESVARTKLSTEKSAIFEAHVEIVKDSVVHDEYREYLIKNEVSAGIAVKTVSSQHIKMFKDMNDEYLSERASDIEDVSDRIIRNVLGLHHPTLSEVNHECILVAKDLFPSETPFINDSYIKGIITEEGGLTSHVAIVAKSLNIPILLGVENILEKVQQDQLIVMNSIDGEVIINPTEKEILNFKEKQKSHHEEISSAQKYLYKKSITKDGVEVALECNIGGTKDADEAVDVNADGIGLFRSEFLYIDSQDWPSLEEQKKQYEEVLTKLSSKPVVVRTLDIGGDKQLPYHEFEKEMNPFLGKRAIRLCMSKPLIFETQIKALLLANKHGNLWIMIPMITTLHELQWAKKEIKKHRESLEAEGHKIKNYKFGIMMETPGAFLNRKLLAEECDFFSIGTNDLIQYTFAADRTNAEVNYLGSPFNFGFLNMLKQIIRCGVDYNIPVAMCGIMASKRENVRLLLGLGLKHFSIPPIDILKIKKFISELDYNEAKKFANKALSIHDDDEIKKFIEKNNCV